MELILHAHVECRTRACFRRAFRIAAMFERISKVRLPKVVDTCWWTAVQRLSRCYRFSVQGGLQHFFGNRDRKVLWGVLLLVIFKMSWFLPEWDWLE